MRMELAAAGLTCLSQRFGSIAAFEHRSKSCSGQLVKVFLPCNRALIIKVQKALQLTLNTDLAMATIFSSLHG